MSNPFVLEQKHPLPALGMQMHLYQHPCGAAHLHLGTTEKENVFAAVFRTPPPDDTGVAHILEHTTLCGSTRYPVNDPFFSMTRRSLSTFMNAMTAPDWTAYPFASNNQNDFFNLLNVYLDAVFSPLLDDLAFAQEGHRLEPESDGWKYSGVVYNEMKGAMDSMNARAWQHLSALLFPDTPYRYNSGGHPPAITDLTVEQLRAFHQRYYCPANSLFLSSGDLPAEAIQQHLNGYLQTAQVGDTASIPKQPKLSQPVQSTVVCPGNDAEAHCVIGWVLGDSVRLDDTLNAMFLGGVLLGDSSSPLSQALESSNLGRAPSSLSGASADLRHPMFMCGLEGIALGKGDAENVAAQVEQLIFTELKRCADEGVSRQQVDNTLHQLELSQRELSGGATPYGLKLLMDSLPALLYGSDVHARLDISQALEQLREQSRSEDFVPNLIRNLLLDNPHRARLMLVPDSEQQANETEQEQQRLHNRVASLSDADTHTLREQDQALKKRQQTQENVDDILPSLKAQDIPPPSPLPKGSVEKTDGLRLHRHNTPGNGLCQSHVLLPLPALDPAQQELLPWYLSLLTQLGVGERNYIQQQASVSAVTGGIDCDLWLHSEPEQPDSVSAWLNLGSIALAENTQTMLELLSEQIQTARFDEHERILECLQRQLTGMERSLAQNGHLLAMLQAGSGQRPGVRYNHNSHGLAGLLRLRSQCEKLKDAENMQAFARQLQELHHAICNTAPREIMLAGEDIAPELVQRATTLFTAQQKTPAGLRLGKPETTPHTAWIIDTQVNYCARSIPTVAYNHPDSAALGVLAFALSNGYLHRSLREQGGAYGGGLSCHAEQGLLRFYSYRDPHIERSFNVFMESVDWFLKTQHRSDFLNESIISTLSRQEISQTPLDLANSGFYARVAAVTQFQREQRQQQVLKTSLKKLKQVADQYLSDANAGTRCALACHAMQSEAERLTAQTLHLHPDH